MPLQVPGEVPIDVLPVAAFSSRLQGGSLKANQGSPEASVIRIPGSPGLQIGDAA